MKLYKLIRWRFFNVSAIVMRLGLGCLFIWSSLPKIRQPYDFLSSVYGYELVGPKMGIFTAMTLPWIELFVGLSLVSGLFIMGALLCSAAMSAIFTFTHASVLYRGLEISCGCFGPLSNDVISYTTLIRAFLILLCSVFLYVLYNAGHNRPTADEGLNILE